MNSKFDTLLCTLYIKLYASVTILLEIYVSGFEKRYNFAQMGDIGIVHCFESTVNELHVALYFASLADSDAEIRSLKVQNYTRCTFVQFAFFHL